ncbi:MAG: hypothetical protein IKS31_09730 [Clostridia bacterium]|nr:hypothetical protein [Clostridia bacterium]
MSDETLILLPDEQETVPLDEGVGMIRAGDSLARLTAAALPPAPPETADEQPEEAAWRGLLAFALLSDLYPEGRLTVETLRADSSPLTGALLKALGTERVSLVFWNTEGRREVLGRTDPAWGILPAVQPPALRGQLPARIRWLDTASRFGDPLPWLTEPERRVLITRLHALAGPQAQRFAEDIAALENRTADRMLAGPESNSWRARVLTTVCLRDEEVFDGLSFIEETHAPGKNALLAALGKQASLPRLPEDGIWYWRGVPFARLNSRLGVEPLPDHAQEQRDTLTVLLGELSRLESCSGTFCKKAAERLQQWLDERRNLLDTRAAREAETWIGTLREGVTSAHDPLSFAFPLDGSPSQKYLLREALGEDAALAECAFSDRLTLVRGGLLGDAVLEDLCRIQLHPQENRTVLPPVSPALAEHMARHSWDQPLLAVDALRFSLLPGSRIEAGFTLRGRGDVTLTRVYASDEQILLEEAPSVSLWPNVALPARSWHAWWLSLRGEIRCACLHHGVWTEIEQGADGDSVHCVDTYPHVIALSRGPVSIGALIAADRQRSVPGGGEVTAAVELGASALKLAVNGSPLQLPGLWRILLRSDPEPAREPLPVGPVQGLLPPCVLLDETADDPLPFEHGRIADEAGDADAVSDLLWQTDGRTRRARRLLLRESAVLLSLAAVLRGVSGLRLRLVLPDGLSDAQRQAIGAEFAAVAEQTVRACGLSSPAQPETVRRLWSLCVWQRSQTLSAAFALVDIGASSACAAVWLRGMERPALSLELGGGMTGFLATAFSLRPEWLKGEFWLAPGTPLGPHTRRIQQAVAAVDRAGTDPAAFSLLQRTLDTLLGPEFRETAAVIGAACSAAMRPSRIQALLLLTFALRLTGAGLMLEKLRWDSTMSIHLPQELPLVICGRAPRMLKTFDSATQWNLSQFPRVAMTQGHPTVSLPLVMSGAQGMEAVTGACLPMQAEQSPALANLNGVLAPAQLAANFLLAFRQAMPGPAEALFPGFFTAAGGFSQTAESLLNAAASRIHASESGSFSLIVEDMALSMLQA